MEFWAGERTIRVGQDFSYHLIAWLIMKYKKYFQKEPIFNGVCLRNNLTKIKNGACPINLDKYISIGNHWVALRVNSDNITQFDSFKVEHFPKTKIKNIIVNKIQKQIFIEYKQMIQ